MRLNCPQRNTYLGGAETPRSLEDLAKDAFEDIRTSFQYRVEYGIPDSALNDIRYRLSNLDVSFLLLRNPRTGVGRFIEGTKRVYILNHDEWIANQRLTKAPTYVGQYLYAPSVVLLHEFNSGPFCWCRNVLIHETLHSVSLYSRIWNMAPDLISKHTKLMEGITECLTGYVLMKKHPVCYNTWGSGVLDKCTIAYRESTKIFCSLAQIAGVTPIAEFYLSVDSDFGIPWNRLVEGIHNAGFNTFNFALDERTAFREMQFREECVRSVPGFRRIYDSRKALDFSQIH
jgi:hypothetical protein